MDWFLEEIIDFFWIAILLGGVLMGVSTRGLHHVQQTSYMAERSSRDKLSRVCFFSPCLQWRTSFGLLARATLNNLSEYLPGRDGASVTFTVKGSDLNWLPRTTLKAFLGTLRRPWFARCTHLDDLSTATTTWVGINVTNSLVLQQLLSRRDVRSTLQQLQRVARTPTLVISTRPGQLTVYMDAPLQTLDWAEQTLRSVDQLSCSLTDRYREYPARQASSFVRA